MKVLFEPKPVPNQCRWEEAVALYRENWNRLEEIDERQKKKGELLHRYITHPYADGQAVYQIVAIGKETVLIKVVTGLGDDWILPAWGEMANISRQQAEEFIRRRDAIEALFSKQMW